MNHPTDPSPSLLLKALLQVNSACAEKMAETPTDPESFIQSKLSKDVLQLPRPPTPVGGEFVDTTRGRFKVIIQTLEIVDNIKVPRGIRAQRSRGQVAG